MNNTKKNNIINDDDIDLIDDSMLAEFETSGLKDFSSKEQTSNANKSSDLDTSDLNVSALCCDEEFSGFDKLTGQKWIYPSNYPVRDYQFNIIRAAIFKNTLVSLPTGLGKTFIAAVLMYNFYRWYPLGKIVFTAPTKPLIAQQIEACYNIIAMPPGDTIEMTGSMNINERKEKWATKRVFFATPQVVINDIKSGICPGKKIRCLVIDEAHKAKSNYAYCHIVSKLTEMEHTTYRILALSATPGNRISDVVQVVKNLHIAHLEFRSENCIDVAPYCFHRNINTVVVPLGPELEALRQKYIVEILESYARRLIELKILKPSDISQVTKGRILMICKEFQMNSRSHPRRNHITLDLTRLITLYHALELLVKHGSRSFLNFFDKHADKSWIQSDDRIMTMLEELRDQLGVNPLLHTDGGILQIPTNICFGHPKYAKVKEIIENHFKKAKEQNQDTRAIVFCEYHETVKLVECLLQQCRPLVTPHSFVGQGDAGRGGRSAMSQREQLEVLNKFRAGVYNALVATCVAEEGLDVGSVNLIVCFDVATKSPLRLVQRCGRTGRERSGQVYFLVTEGKEHQTLIEGMRQRDSLKSKIFESREVQDNLYPLNRRLIPNDITPKCEKMYITVKKPATSNGKNVQQGKIKKKQGKQSVTEEELLVADTPNLPIQNKSQASTAFSSPKKEDSKISAKPSGSPKKSPNKVNKKSKQGLAKPNNNADIRALFLAANKSKQNGVKIANEILNQKKQMSAETLDLYFDLAVEAKKPITCYICNDNCDCQNILKLKKGAKNNYKNILNYDLKLPDIDLLDDFTAESILEYSLAISYKKYDDDVLNNSIMPLDYYEPDIDNNVENDYNTVHVSNLDNDLNTMEDFQILQESKKAEECKKIELDNNLEESKTTEVNFDIGDADDLFVLSPREAEANKMNETTDEKYKISPIDFDLGSFDDLEVTVDNNNKVDYNERSCKVNDVIDLSHDRSPETEKDFVPPERNSPSILSGSHQIVTKSPILTSQRRNLKLKRKSEKDTSHVTKLNARKHLNYGNEQAANLSNSMLSTTQIIDLINTCEDEEEGRLSPIILTQADRKKQNVNNSTPNKSTNETQLDVEITIHHSTPSSSTHKRKSNDVISSPYFSKKPKVEIDTKNGHDTIQNKIFAVLTSNEMSKERRFPNDVINLNCTTFISTPDLKENRYSVYKKPIKKENDILNLIDFSYTPKKEVGIKKAMEHESHPKITGKITKKKKTKHHNSLLELEAELSDEAEASADELSDDSAGSLVHFISDEHHSPTDDMHALYLQSIKSPLKTGAFKIPQLPPNYRNSIIYSQFAEQDSYEMDSFCVDSHVGLTQVNDLSTLDLAEIILKEERKRKRKSKGNKQIANEQNDSPVINRKKGKRRNVISDSEDSS